MSAQREQRGERRMTREEREARAAEQQHWREMARQHNELMMRQFAERENRRDHMNCRMAQLAEDRSRLEGRRQIAFQQRMDEEFDRRKNAEWLSF